MPLSIAEVKALMLAKAAGSLLAPPDVAKLKFKPMTADDVKDAGYNPAAAAFSIPYFDINGKVTKFARIRYVEDTRRGFDKLSGKKSLRYSQLPNTVNEAYFPPFVEWGKYLDKRLPVVITEGELKAACATKVGVPTIGLGGVWCFKSNRKGQSLIAGLAAIDWSGRSVVICYDSDAVTNPNVIVAENMLAQTLLNLGADVSIARLPNDGEKVGLDDYLLTHTPKDLMDLVNSAPSYAGSEALHALCEQVVYIRDPGLVYDYQHCMRLGVQQFTQHAYANLWHDEMSLNGKVVKVQTAKKWVEWSGRTELSEVTFAPGEEKVFNNKLNTWDGWPFEPVKGDVTPWKRLLDHLFADSNDPASRKWFEQWAAYPIQHPGAKLPTAVLFWGRVQGSGKTIIGETLMRLYGDYATELKDANLMADDFSWAQDKQFALADEITGQDNRLLKKRLMSMITQKQIYINIKFVPKYSIPDCINYYFTAQDCDAFYMDDGDRRFFIHEVRSDKMPVDLRATYKAWKNSDEGISALMYYLMKLDLTGFDPDAEAYVTEDKKTMIALTKGDLANWVMDLKDDPDRKLKLPGDLFTAGELLEMYDPLNSGKVTKNGMARELTRAGFRPPGKTGAMAVTQYGNVRLYAIKNRSFWGRQVMKDVVTHYEAHRMTMPANKRKF